MIGKTISHYKITEKLGEGGMGEVYLGYDLKLERQVAIKFLPEQLTKDKENVERFEREAKAAAALNHPNIITIYDILEADSQIYIVMEYVDGKSLRSSIDEQKLNVEEILNITNQICEGLSEAHKTDIVHRDIKPENILVDRRGRVKVLDFGLAKLKGVSKLTTESSTLGTIHYMSPEQLQGKEVDHRSDIWSLGVVLYELLMGEVPFKGSYEQVVIYSIMNVDPKPMTALRPGVPTELEEVVNKAMAKATDARYQHVDDFRVDLNRLKNDLESGVTFAPEPISSSTNEQVKKSIRSKSMRILIGSITLILMIVGLQLILRKGKDLSLKVTNEKSIAVLPFSSITKTVEDESFSDGIHDDILTQLTKIGDLKVIARTSVIQYRNTQKRISEIAQELGVNSILEGTVRRSGNQIRIGAQLIDANTENHLWAETYDREYSDIFAIQSDVAQKIAYAMKVTLTADEKHSIERKPTEDVKAYDYYLKGNYYLNNYDTKEGYEKAVQMYDRAVELDHTFALAYTKLVKVNALLYVFKTWDHTIERLEKCRTALTKAIELAPDLPEVHFARGYYMEWIEGDYDQALAEYETTLQDRPNDSNLLGSLGIIFLRMGEAERAVEYFIRSYERDPKSINQGLWTSWSYQLQRKWAEAERWINIYIANHPDHALGHWRKVGIYILGYGDMEKARSVLAEGLTQAKYSPAHYLWMIELYSRNYQKALAELASETRRPHYTYLKKGQLFDLMGEHEKAKANYDSASVLLKKMIEKQPENAFHYAALGLVHAGLGHKDEAIRWGKRAVELHPIRSDPYASGEEILLDMANINIIVGEYEEAIDQIETLLSIPSQVTKWRLKLDPIYDPICNIPRFQKILEEQ
jgi:non-specific serine/threonine protein kinase